MIQLIPILLLVSFLYDFGKPYQEIENAYGREEPKDTTNAGKQSSKKRKIIAKVSVLVFYHRLNEVEIDSDHEVIGRVIEPFALAKHSLRRDVIGRWSKAKVAAHFVGPVCWHAPESFVGLHFLVNDGGRIDLEGGEDHLVDVDDVIVGPYQLDGVRIRSPLREPCLILDDVVLNERRRVDRLRQ